MRFASTCVIDEIPKWLFTPWYYLTKNSSSFHLDSDTWTLGLFSSGSSLGGLQIIKFDVTSTCSHIWCPTLTLYTLVESPCSNLSPYDSITEKNRKVWSLQCKNSHTNFCLRNGHELDNWINYFTQYSHVVETLIIWR